MRKKREARIALMCIALFSRQLLAAPGGFQSTGISVDAQTKGSFSPSPLTPTRKIPGTFSSPSVELSKGHLASARVSCIQRSLSDGALSVGVDPSSAWEFSAKGSSSLVIPALKPISAAFLRREKSGAARPAAFQNKACSENPARAEGCMKLLAKSINEVPQAYYNSALQKDASVWKEISEYFGLFIEDGSEDKPKDFTTAISDAAKKEAKEHPSAPSNAILDPKLLSEDPLLLASRMLIARIDEMLARGNAEGVSKAKKLLAKINPSAAHGIDCVLSSVNNGGLNDQLDPSGRPVQGSLVGPLTGSDYGAQDALKTQGMGAVVVLPIIIAGVVAATGIATLITTWVNKAVDNEHWKKEQEHQKAVMAADQLKEYTKCQLGAACDKLYPDAARAVKEAKADTEAEKTSATAGSAPRRPVENDDIFKPIINVKPGEGSGGNGGEMLPPDFVKDPVPAIVTAKPGDLVNTRVDLNAADNFCQQTLRDFEGFTLKKATGGGRPVELDVDLNRGAQLSLGAESFGIMTYDNWDDQFWAEAEQIYNEDPNHHAKDNSCKSMDSVRPE